MAEYNPSFHSPITIPRPVSLNLPKLGVSDLSGAQATMIQGKADDLLQQYFPNLPARPGDMVDIGSGLLARLTPAELYLFGKSPAARLPSAAELDGSFAQVQRFAHATDFTHGKAILKLVGETAAVVLSKICGLNFQNTAFPDLQVKQTSAAKIKTLIARCDEAATPAYFLHVDRSLGQYFFEVVWDAGREFDIGVRI